MEKQDHFSHQHKLTFHKSLEGALLTCTGCNFPCTGTPVYSCRPCKFFLHEQCFNAPRSLNHPSHPDHPLSLFPSPTYASRSFLCNLCNMQGSGFCFGCTICGFDIHVHCAYDNNGMKPKTEPSSQKQPKPATSPPRNQNQIQIKSHPTHALRYLPKPPYDSGECSCDVCGTLCDPNVPIYNCVICGYDAHLECVRLPQIAKRQDHAHQLSLLHVNTYERFECDVCKNMISKNNCLYVCKSGCDYGMHVKCVSATVANMDARRLQEEIFKTELQMRSHQNILNSIYGCGCSHYYCSHRY